MEKDGIWWNGRTSTDVADGLKCFSLAGLGVEEKDGEGTIPHSKSTVILEYGMKKISCLIFNGKLFVHASVALLQLSVCFCSCFQ